ncbi:WhiB family transcriptional regulator [Rhodococcus sp. NPDC055112]
MKDAHRESAHRAPTTFWNRQIDALCRNMSQDLFFEHDGVQHGPRLRHEHAVKQVCARRPVQRAYRNFAVESDQRFGIWGGTSDLDRRKQRRTA